jgi:tetratricopeptide (TPR) repeat protein
MSRIVAALCVVLIVASAKADEAALYREGVKKFQAEDYVGAGRALSQLAPFTQEFGEEARYLLARVHDLSGERPEAIGLYEAIIDYHMRCKGEAANALSRPDSMKDRAEEKARLEKVLKERTPEYVVRSRFYCGRLLVEEGRYEDALARLSKAQQDAQGQLGNEVKLWLGVAQVQTKRFDEAIRNLSDAFGPEALRWLARAQVGAGVTPVQLRQNGAGILPNQEQRKAAFEAAIASLTKAVQLQGALRDSRGPDADEIRTNIELGDLLRQAGHYPAAVERYAEAGRWGDAQLAEVAKYRHAVALQLAGKYAEADEALGKFEGDYPRSGKLADAAVRYAENALLAKRFEEATLRFEAVRRRYANTEQAYLATLGLASLQYQIGNYDEAMKIASTIPDGERLGDLAAANYLIADCQLRALPADEGEDALATARLIQDLSDLGDRFKSFMLAHEAEPQSVDAALKLGYCLQRQAGMLADPTERRKATSAARRMYMTLVRQFPDHPLYPVMVLESARCTSVFGGRMAENELARFEFEPLKSSALAPMAMVRLGQMMRNSRRAEAAVKLLSSARSDYESALMKEAAKIVWAAGLRYELGMALKESGKYGEAREVFESALKDFSKQPQAAEIPWRIAQCEREAAMEQLLPVRKLFGRRDGAEQARSTLATPLEQLRAAGKMMIAEARQRKDEPEFAAQIAFEAGGCWRMVAEYEAEAARVAAQEETQRMRQQQRSRPRLAAATTRPATAPTTLPANQVVVAAGHESAKEARACYQTILEIAPDSPTAADARAMLVEMDQNRPMREWRGKSLRVTSSSRMELPAVLNLDGGSEFARLAPLVRSNSSDLADEGNAGVDEGLIARQISLPEDWIAAGAGQN